MDLIPDDVIKRVVEKYIPDYKVKTNFIYVIGKAEYLDIDSIFKVYKSVYITY